MKKLKLTLILLVVAFITSCDALINPEPNMFVYQGSTEIEMYSDSVDFGRIEVNTTYSIILKIQNKGKKKLLLTGNPLVNLQGFGGEGYFSVVTQPQDLLKPGESTTFTIKFSPTEAKIYRIAVFISNTDRDKNEYYFRIRGTGIIPDINVRQGSQDIPIDRGVYDFGSVYRHYTSPKVVFTIENIGSSKLSLTGSPDFIEISGAHASVFIIDQTMTTSPITANNSTTFTIVFAPKDIGVKTARISIPNTDPDEDPYVFTIRGTGVAKKPTFDFNGDGIADFIIGNSHYDEHTAYIFLGKEFFNPDIEMNEADIIIKCNDTYLPMGSVMSAFGDFNGDGYDDVAISNHLRKEPHNKGVIYIIFGRSNPKNKINTSDADITIDYGPAPTIGSGDILRSCDFNNDGFDDLVVYNFQHLLIFYGSDNTPNKISSTNADVRIMDDDYYTDFAESADSIGDFNGDGYDDIAIGALHRHSDDRYDYTYIFFGGSDVPSVMEKTDANVRIVGEIVNDGFGKFVGSAGDFNNDGLDDLMIGSNFVSETSQWTNEVFIFFGNRNMPAEFSASNANVRITSPDETFLAECFDCVGDVNNDNCDDILIYNDRNTQPDNSKSFLVFYGSRTPDSVISISDANVKFVSNHTSNNYRNNLTSVGDLNYDGFNDLVISNFIYNDDSKLVGNVYAYFGKFDKPSYNISEASIHFYNNSKSFHYGLSLSGGR